jgi:RNA polymerase sigma-70 factor (sigma-E family)
MMLNGEVYEGAVDERGARIERLYAAHIEEATRLAFLLTGDRALAEDMAQDAFVKAAGRFQHLRDEAAFGSYFMKAVVNRCRAHWRRRKVELGYIDRLKKQPGRTGPEPDVSGRLEIMQALDALSPRQRAAVVLRHYLDLSERRTADLMGCSVGTVKTLTSRGLQAMRERMEP